MLNDRKRDLRTVIEDEFDNDVTLAVDFHASDVSNAAHTPEAMKSAQGTLIE